MEIARILTALALVAFAGCSTSPVAFVSSSIPVPQKGYTICGSEVSGISTQVWVFGLGGSFSTPCLQEAYQDALAHSNGADALVGMSVELSTYAIPPFFMQSDTRVTGTPVKFNVVGK